MKGSAVVAIGVGRHQVGTDNGASCAQQLSVFVLMFVRFVGYSPAIHRPLVQTLLETR